MGGTLIPKSLSPIDLSAWGSQGGNYPQPCFWYSEKMVGYNPEVLVLFSVYPAEYKYMPDTLPKVRKMLVTGNEYTPVADVIDQPQFGRDAFAVPAFVAPTTDDPGSDACTYYLLSADRDVLEVTVADRSGRKKPMACDQATDIVEMLF